MDRAGGIVELLADYSQVRRQIRTYSLQDAEKLFNTLMLQTFFYQENGERSCIPMEHLQCDLF